MTVTPGICWQTIRAVIGSEVEANLWTNPTFAVGAPAGITLAHTDALRCFVLVVGDPSNDVIAFTASCPAGGSVFSVASGLADLEVGQAVVCATSGILPGGLQVIGIDQPSGSDVVLGGGAGPWAYPANPWIFSMPATVALTTSDQLYAIDSYPVGTLAVTVSPSTGVTVADWNMDGSYTQPDPTGGDGTSMSNSGGQAMGLFQVTFPAAGAYTVEVTYSPVNPTLLNPDDPVYSATQSTLTVEVT
ncbi:hypothetical protein [Conexibacter sp. S30A1]|uniref:hypothetical protein n=1 Tax=Conexibacter sp. S30A1 TaxID=2937800 RepID=UPI00200BEE67|nr:hypothetical protein [Conexibacter sp. S30A1]